jgi:hypothetical protein
MCVHRSREAKVQLLAMVIVAEDDACVSVFVLMTTVVTATVLAVTTVLGMTYHAASFVAAGCAETTSIISIMSVHSKPPGSLCVSASS